MKPEEPKPQLQDLPVLPLRDVVVFPAMVTPLIVSRPRSMKLVEEVAAGDKTLCLVAQKSAEEEDPAPGGLHAVGTVAMILKMLKFPDGSVRIIIQGVARARIGAVLQTEPFFRAAIETLPDTTRESVEVQALTRNVLTLFQRVVSLSPTLPDELHVTAMNLEDPGKLADFIASSTSFPREEKQTLLETVSVQSRLQHVARFLTRELQVLELGSKIQSQVQTEITKTQREYFLREQLKAIKKELGEIDEGASDLAALRKRITDAKLPEEALKEANRELARLEAMHPSSAEYSVARTYLDWITALPWAVETEDSLHIRRAARILDRDHHGLKKVKERILEFLSVLKLKRDLKGPILCLVGPPGVGKTSLGRSIAEALGRRFIRVSLGGIRDEAEIRGHRRTYVGALPGRIIQGLRKAGSRNPVFILDEIDKMSADFRGDPSSALLEALDPEQNAGFSDHYLDVPFDLSRVLFLTTANIMDTIPPALADRMEVIRIPGYTEEEKLVISQKHLLPRALKNHGLKRGQVTFTRKGLQALIGRYTREAGVRNLERELAAVCRKVAKRTAEGRRQGVRVTPQGLHGFLGPERFPPDTTHRKREVGVAIGLAWTEFGGEVLYVEASRMRGAKGLALTGQLGDVMKESAQAALSYIRSHARRLGIDPRVFAKTDLHIHVPAGATPKDGPSAGVTMATALVSCLSRRPIRPDVAMTGELTLRGTVLAVGGVKEKVLAARRLGIREIILPRFNKTDLEDIPKEIRRSMKFHFVGRLGQVLKIALEAPHANGTGKAKA